MGGEGGEIDAPDLGVGEDRRAVILELHAEHGGVPRLPGRRRLVLDEGAHHRRGALGAQRVAPLATIFEDVHLFGEYVALLANTAKEDPDILKERIYRQREAVAIGALGERGEESLP